MPAIDSLQHAAPVDEDVTCVDEICTVWPLYVYIPLSSILVPVCCGDFVLKFHILEQIVVHSDLLEVLPDLGRLRIVLRPIGIPCPCELIRSRRNIACASRVSGTASATTSWHTQSSLPVLEPRSTNILVLLIDLDFDILKPLLRELGETYPTRASANVNYSHLALRAVRLVEYAKAISVRYRPSSLVALSHISGEAFAVPCRCHA
jgi:hypothetical protein